MNSSKQKDFLDLNKSVNVFGLYELCKDKEETIKYLQNKGLLKTKMCCPTCRWEMRKSGDFWHCYKTRKTKKGKKNCGKRVCIKNGTWFGKTKLSFGKVLLLTYMLVKNYKQMSIAHELKISKKTVSLWSGFVKQVVLEWFQTQDKPLGGPGKTVEVDAFKFGKTTHGGHAVEGKWVFGAIERISKKLVLIPVDERNSQNLTPLIKKWILPETKIVLDCSKGSRNINYEDLTVNHSVTFIYKENGDHNNIMESMWRQAKRFLAPYNRKKENFTSHLAHFCMIYKTKQEKVDLFNFILEQISQMDFTKVDSLAENKSVTENENKSKISEGKI